MALLKRYMRMANISTDHPSDKYLFRRLVDTINGQRLRDSANLINTCACELVLDMLEAVGLDRKLFNLRSGGATAAVNAGVPDRCFKRHGWWRSETAKDGYVQDKLESLKKPWFVRVSRTFPYHFLSFSHSRCNYPIVINFGGEVHGDACIYE